MPLIDEAEPHEAATELSSARAAFPDTEPPRSRLAVPVPASMPRPLDEVLDSRRSVRQFAARRLSVDALFHVLATAYRQQDGQWPVGRHGCPHLDVLVAAYDIAEVEGGLYPYEPGTGRFGEPLHTDGMPDLGDAYAHAPALLLIRGPVRGTPGASYGNLLVRAGALGHAIWLAALTVDLACSVYGGTSEWVGRLTRRDPAHLFTVAVGYADTTVG